VVAAGGEVNVSGGGLGGLLRVTSPHQTPLRADKPRGAFRSLLTCPHESRQLAPDARAAPFPSRGRRRSTTPIISITVVIVHIN